MSALPPPEAPVGCLAAAATCRAQHIAPRLRDAKPDGGDYEARCPVCGHGGFRISQPKVQRYRNIWTCECKRCKCPATAIRSALLALGIRAGCLGVYLLAAPAAADPMKAAALREAVDLILGWPGLDSSQIRLILAEARGDKFPEEYGEFAKFAQSIGIGRRHSYNLAAELCRPADASSSPEGGVVDTES